MTCKALREVVHQHSVWASVLRSLCKRDGLFLLLYPIEDMDLREIQRVVLSPRLWKFLLEKKSILPLDLQKSLPLPANTRRGNLHGHAAYLTTGGRFCVTFHRKDAVFVEIEIWDFGLPGSQLFEKPRRIGSRTEQLGSAQERVDMIGTLWEERGDTLTMVVAQKRTIPPASGNEYIAVLLSTISFQGGLASVTPLAPLVTISQNVSMWPCNMILRSGYPFLYEMTGTVYVLYSLATDRCTMWKTGQPGFAVTTTIFDSEHVIRAAAETVSRLHLERRGIGA